MVKPLQITEVQEIFAKNLKNARWTLGISQQVVADRAGIPRSYVADLERCRFCPTLNMVDAVAKALGIEVYVLLKPPRDYGKAR